MLTNNRSVCWDIGDLPLPKGNVEDSIVENYSDSSDSERDSE